MGIKGGWNQRHDPPGVKWCPLCKSLIAHELYCRSKTGFRGFGSGCKACKAKLSAAHRVKLRQRTEISQHDIDRFWSLVDKSGPNGCHVWRGALRNSYDRYGAFEVNGRTVGPHIMVYRLAGIEIPKGMHVDHMCRNRLCCNRDHLRIVPPRVNALENNDSPFAINKRKTHCKYGHPLSGDNIRVTEGVSERGSKTINRLCLACYGPGGIRKTKAGRARTNVL